MTSLFIVLAASGCTFEDGGGFGTLEEATVTARLEPGAARDLGGGAVLTAMGYRVQVDAASLAVESIALETVTGGEGGGGIFDPADPPFGCTLCHGGHCHCPGGELVSYEELQARLSGGGAAAYTTLASAALDAELTLRPAGTATTGAFEPGPVLPRTTIARVTVPLGRFHVEGSVTAAALGDRVVPLAIDLDVDGPMTALVSQDVDRGTPARIRIDVDLLVDGTVFDGLDFPALEVAGRIDITAMDAPGAETLLTALLQSIHENTERVVFR
jgi:hypothetical protein